MNKKILLGTTVLISVAAALALSDKLANSRDERIGRPMATIASLLGMDAIRIAKGDKELLLVTDKDSVWRMGSDTGFPADAAKVGRLIDDLTRSDVQMLVSEAKEPSESFGLATATEVTLRKAGSDVLSLKLADQRDRGGQFIAFGRDHRVYLINQPMAIVPEESSWELKRLLNVSANQIQRLEFKPAAASGKKEVVLLRNKAEDAVKIETLPTGAKESSQIRSHEGILSAVDYTKREVGSSPDAQKAMAKPSVLMATLFDGRSFEVKVGSIGDASKRYFISIVAKSGQQTPSKEAQEIDWLNSVMQSHTFEVSSMVAERFFKGLDDMLEKKGSKS